MKSIHDLTINQLLLSILVGELVILLLLIISAILRRFWIYYKERKEQKDKHTISRVIIDSLKGKEDPKILQRLKRFKSKPILLSSLELFDRRFNDERWQNLKKQIAESYLLPGARRRMKSFYWLKRNFSARCFALVPLSQDIKNITTLIDDPLFLVRSIAAKAAVKLEIKEGIDKIIHQMSREIGYARYLYRDILLQGKSRQIFSWIAEIAALEKDPDIHLACLEALSSQTLMLSLPFLKQDLESKDPNIRLAALKVLIRNPQKDLTHFLLKSLEDPSVEVRIQAAKGLEHIASKESLEKLEKVLTNDPSWPVIVRAAWSLKNMGKRGIDILNAQNPSKNKRAYEAVQYAMQFDW